VLTSEDDTGLAGGAWLGLKSADSADELMGGMDDLFLFLLSNNGLRKMRSSANCVHGGLAKKLSAGRASNSKSGPEARCQK
jgi:hypothetical protein